MLYKIYEFITNFQMNESIKDIGMYRLASLISFDTIYRLSICKLKNILSQTKEYWELN